MLRARFRARSLGFGLDVTALAVLSVGQTGRVQASISPKQLQAGAATPQATADKQVTLATGDRITLSGGDPAQAALNRRPGRSSITFSTQRTKDHFYAVPCDVQHQVAGGRFDRRSFDVTGLIKAA